MISMSPQNKRPPSRSSFHSGNSGVEPSSPNTSHHSPNHQQSPPTSSMQIKQIVLANILNSLTDTYRTIEKYVSPIVVNIAKSYDHPLLLPIQQKRRIIMIIDVIAFGIPLRTDDSRKIMGKYISIIRKILLKYHGYILNRTGHLILAVFDEKFAHQAVKSALAIIKTVRAKMPISSSRSNLISTVFESGIFLTDGDVLEGSFGDGTMMDYQIIGPCVRRAVHLSLHLPSLPTVFCFDASIRDLLKISNSAFDGMVEHVTTLDITLPGEDSTVELYTIGKKDHLKNTISSPKSQNSYYSMEM